MLISQAAILGILLRSLLLESFEITLFCLQLGNSVPQLFILTSRTTGLGRLCLKSSIAFLDLDKVKDDVKDAGEEEGKEKGSTGQVQVSLGIESSSGVISLGPGICHVLLHLGRRALLRNPNHPLKGVHKEDRDKYECDFQPVLNFRYDRILAQEMEHLFADCERHGADDRAEERELCHEEDEAYCGLSVGARGGERRRTGVVELRG